jgi:hypothetical protein
MSTATLAKTAAENQLLKTRVAELEAKVAASDKRAAAEQMLIENANDPRAPLEMRPVDVEDFLAKRAQLEALPSIEVAKTAVKMASTRSFTVGEPDASTPTNHVVTGSKAEDDFVNSFLGSESAS